MKAVIAIQSALSTIRSPGLTPTKKPGKKSARSRKKFSMRVAQKGATLADLYDPDVMPADLRKAHRALDAAVDKLYRPAPFASDRERVEHLFGLYQKLVAPLAAMAVTRLKPPRARRSG